MPGEDKRLERPREGRMVAGVCAGIAGYFGLDVSLVRIGYALLQKLQPVALADEQGVYGTMQVFPCTGQLQAGLGQAAYGRHRRGRLRT